MLFFPPPAGTLGWEEKLGGGGGGGILLSAAPSLLPVSALPRLACDSSGGGAPGFERETNGGGAPMAPPPGRIPLAESRLFVTMESRAGGGGAKAVADIGAMAARAAAEISSELVPPLPWEDLRSRFVLGVPVGVPSGLVDPGEPPPPPKLDGEGSSDPPSFLEDTSSPHTSVVSDELPMSLNLAAALPARVAASEAWGSGATSSSA